MSASKQQRILVAASLLLVAAWTGCSKRETRQRFDNAPVIIISIDTLRADHLPMFGYKNVETPHLDALRADSILFTSAYATAPLTFPSHVSALTGLWPPQHKVRNNIGYTFDPAMATIPTTLKARGYETGAAISSYVLRGNTGLARAFDWYEDNIVTRANVPVGNLQRPGAETVTLASRWISERKDKPFFFMLHLFEPHSPYEPPEPFRSRYREAYDGEIAASDAIVGDFIANLKRDAIYDKAVIIVMSDHGEGLYEHGEPEHGIFLYREAIHVPLLVKLPDGNRKGETKSDPVSLVDIFPTIASITGVTLPPNLPGRSLLAVDPQAKERRVYSETLYPRIHLGWSELRSLAGERFHFVQAPNPELYDMRADPGEKKNILAEERRTYASMRDELAAYGTDVTGPGRIDPEEARKLAALGYLGSTSAQPKGPLPDPKDRIGEVAQMVAAMKFAHDGEHAKAVVALRDIVAKNPGLSDAWNQMGTSFELLGRYEEAADAYRRAIEMTPELAHEFGLRLGSVLMRLERYDDAAKHARLGESTNPGGANVLLARIEMAQKHYAKADEFARKAESDTYSRIPARVLRAQALAQQERAAEGLALIEDVAAEAQRRKLGTVESLEFVRGDALARLQRYDPAIEALRREIEHFPQNKQAYASLFVIYMLQGRIAEADATLQDLARANANKRGYLFIAHTLESIGDNRGAAAWRGRAASLR